MNAMNAQLAERAMQVFEQVFEFEGDDRENSVREACAGDDDLRREVDMLLNNISGVDIVVSKPAVS